MTFIHLASKRVRGACSVHATLCERQQSISVKGWGTGMTMPGLSPGSSFATASRIDLSEHHGDDNRTVLIGSLRTEECAMMWGPAFHSLLPPVAEKAARELTPRQYCLFH